MKKQITSICTAVLLGMSVLTAPVQAANFPLIQPYMTDYKIGFTNGNAIVTKPIYDEYSQYPSYTVVTKGGKKGILDAKTGKELTPAIWDEIEIPDSQNIAIVRKGGWFQYLNLTTSQLSSTKFAGAHTYYLSPAYPSVIAMGGQTSMLLDTSGKVLIPPFAGKLSIVDLVDPGEAANQDAQTVRYVSATASKQITLYDPVKLKPRFTLKNAELIPNEGGPKTAYLKVRSGGKEGLVDRNGKYALAPKYNALYFWGYGYVRVVGPKGAGLWKDGRMLAEPQFADVGITSNDPDVYTTMAKETITYHSVSKATSFTLKKGAPQYLRDGYVLGQDPKTGLYGVIHAGGETVVPFAYPRVEGPPAAQLLVRSDGKKGIIPGWGLPMGEPAFWFDSITTLGSYSMLSIRDGKKIGLYSDRQGLIFEPRENTVIRYEDRLGRVLVTGPDGKTTAYGFDGKEIIGDQVSGDQASAQPPLSDQLYTSRIVENGMVIMDRETKQAISKPYRAVYAEVNSKLIVGLDQDVADLFTPDGKLLTAQIKVPRNEGRYEEPPVWLVEVGGAYYTMGAKEGANGRGLIKIQDGELQAVSGFDYLDFVVRQLADKKMFVLTRTDGTIELWGQEGDQVVRKLKNIVGYETSDGLGAVFIQDSAGWDLYSAGLERVTNGNYRTLKLVVTSNGQHRVIVYQDQKTGLYGLLAADGKLLVGPKYESIRATDQVFPQWLGDSAMQPPFLFTTKQQFGYLDASGQELFKTAFLTKKPTITYRSMNAQAFLAYGDLMRQNPLELIDFGKPYSWPDGVSSEQKFFANLALYLDLPKEAGKREVWDALVSKGIIKPDSNRASMSDADMYALSYYMATGKTSQSLTPAELQEWAQKRGIVRERGGHNYYQTMDLYAEHHQLFFSELIRTQAGNKKFKPKTLTLATLSQAQKQMLTPMIVVNGRGVDQLPLPLPLEESNKALQHLVSEYNKQAAALFAAYTTTK